MTLGELAERFGGLVRMDDDRSDLALLGFG